MSLTIGFIGGGNMAAALIGGLAVKRPDARFIVIDPSEAALNALAARFAVETALRPDERLARCDALIMAVKPQHMRAAAEQLASMTHGQLIISVAAGIRSTDLMGWLGGQAAVVRCMPNTPALIGAGSTGLYAANTVNPGQRNLAGEILSAVGEIVWVTDEAQLDGVTALSGSGPAYVFYFIEAMEAGGIALGLPAETARQLALATMLGGARLATESGESPAVLRERVTSRGGTTQAALQSMDADGVGEAIIRAMRAAAQRAAELGDEFGKN